MQFRLCLTILACAAWLGGAPASAQGMSESQGRAITQQAKSLEIEAGRLIEAGQFGRAESNLKEAERLIGQLPERTGRLRWKRGAMLGGVQGELGRMYFQQGRYAEAEAAFRREIDAVEQEFGKDSVTMVTPLLQIVNLRMREGKFDGVEAMLLRAQALDARAGGPTTMTAAEIANALAIFYVRSGQADKAEPTAEKAEPKADAADKAPEDVKAQA